jgi:hypothetical protein
MISSGNQTHLFRIPGIRYIRPASSLAFSSTYLGMSNLALLTSTDSLPEIVSCPESPAKYTYCINRLHTVVYISFFIRSYFKISPAPISPLQIILRW